MSTITFPSVSVSASEVEIGLKASTQISVSDLSGYVQTLELPGARWTLSFRFPSLEAADAALLESLQAQMRGQANRVRVPVWGRTAPRGTWAGSPVVNNEVGSPTLSQTGHTLILKGFSAGATVKDGDLLNIGSGGQLVRNIGNGTADGSGNLTITVEPGIRVAPAHDTAIVTSNVVVPYMIATDPHLRYRLMPGNEADFAFDLVEVFE